MSGTQLKIQLYSRILSGADIWEKSSAYKLAHSIRPPFVIRDRQIAYLSRSCVQLATFYQTHPPSRIYSWLRLYLHLESQVLRIIVGMNP